MPQSYQDPNGCSWTEHNDGEGYVFYFNESTQVRKDFNPGEFQSNKKAESAHMRAYAASPSLRAMISIHWSFCTK